MNHSECLYTVNRKKGGDTFMVITMENVFNDFFLYLETGMNTFCR